MINALAILMLIFTGISLQYSDPIYPFMRFDLAVAFHNYCGILLSINYFLFLFSNIVTGNVRHYYFRIKGYIGLLLKQANYYAFGIFKGQTPPFPINETRKFNPLQQFSYNFVMYIIMPIMIITGVGLLFPDVLPKQILWNGGVFVTDLFHIIGGFVVSVFLIVHVYFCTIGAKPLKNFKSIVNGYHEDNH